MDKNSKIKVVILGAGVSGLSAGYSLSLRGFNITIIEKNDFVGGLAASFSHEGYCLDYGPHNFHTHIPWVISFLEDELGVSLKKIPFRPAKIFFNGQIVDYPINILNCLRRINFIVSLRCFIDFLLVRIRIKLRRNVQDESFKDWVENRFGKYLYDIYFGSYVEKIWGIPGYELDAVIAKKRIPEPSLLSLVLRVLTGIRLGAKHSEDPHITDSYYPKEGGIGIITDKLAQHIRRQNGQIELNSTIHSIVLGGDKGHIIYSVNGARKEIEFDYLVNTIPLNILLPYLSWSDKGAETPEGSSFIYRGTIFLYLVLSRLKVTEHPWIYFNERDNKDLIFNRMYEVSNFTSMEMDNKDGIICLEISCYKDDAVWKKTDSDLFESCITFLQKNNFLAKDDVKSCFTKRVEEAYPVFRKGYLMHLLDVLDYFKKSGNIFSIGRQGLFSYTNIDHCIDMGLRMGKLVKNGGLDSSRFFEVYKDYIG